MAQSKLPGPLCRFLGALEIDAGTLCRQASPLPGVVNHAHQPTPHRRRKRHQQAKSIKVPARADGTSKISSSEAAAQQLKAAKVFAPAATSKISPAEFEAAAQQLGGGIPVALLRAFAEVESGGKSGFGPLGLPVIAFEGHWFRKFTHKVYDVTHPFLSYPYVKKAGPEWVHNNKDQVTAWKTLEEALALNHDAALKSCSWGMFQVMGFNYASCGYKTVDDFVAAMKAGEAGQLLAFVGFCKANPACLEAMRKKDFKGMAIGYNGPDYGDYDKRIEKAYKKYGGT